MKNGIVNHVECNETSVYKIGSRGHKGVEAVVKQTLKFANSRAGSTRIYLGPFSDKNDITFEFSDKSVDDLEYKSVDANKFIADVCQRTQGKEGLDDEHANNFRALVNKLETMSQAELINFYETSKAKCVLGG